MDEIMEINGKEYKINLPKEIEEAFTCIDYELSVCNDELPKILDYIIDLKKQLEATEKACIEWKKKYEETNKR
jgi:hypothetical protein